MLQAFEMRFKGLFDSDRISHADKSRHAKAARNMIAQANRWRNAGYELINERRGIGKPCGFNDDPGERAAQGFGGSMMKFVQGRSNVASDGAADAAGGRDHQLAFADLNEVVIQGDFAELVHNHGRVAHGWMRRSFRNVDFPAPRKQDRIVTGMVGAAAMPFLSLAHRTRSVPSVQSWWLDEKSESHGVGLKTRDHIGFRHFIDVTAITANGEDSWTMSVLVTAARDISIDRFQSMNHARFHQS
jgi:hypothetical protein